MYTESPLHRSAFLSGRCICQWTLLTIMVALRPIAAVAQSSSDAGDPAGPDSAWRISGFGTAGAVHVDTDQPWLLARDVTQPGASSATSVLVDSRVGMQLNWQINPQWEAVAQAVFKERTGGADADESLELGFVAYSPSPRWTLRLGRVKPDLFLLADVRSVGYAMPWVRPNVEFYGWIPGASLNGLNAAYQWQRGSTDWVARLWAGELRSSVSALRTDSRVLWKGRDSIAFTLTGKTGALTMKASYLQSRTDLGSDSDLMQLEQTLLGLATLPATQVAADARSLYKGLIPQGRTRYAGLGAEYDTGRWLVAAEASRVWVHRGLAGGTRGYVSLGHRWGVLTGFAMAGISNPDHAAPRVTTDWATDLTPLLGAPDAQMAAMVGGIAEVFAADARFDQRSISAGLRWDVRDRVALKFQVDHVAVGAYGAAQWRHSTVTSGSANVFSTVLDWVF